MISPGDDDESDEAPPQPGMLRTTPDEAAKAEKAAAAARAARAAEDAPTVDEARLKELKDKARSEIDARLKERRKKRRLMRGGDTGTHPAVS